MAFTYEHGAWSISGRALADFCAHRTKPFYLYDLDDVRLRARRLKASKHRVHFAMKANSNARLLNVLREEGLGVDVVSLGELQKALRLGFRPDQVIFSGVGKDDEELSFALAQRILQINVESFEELQALARLRSARTGPPADIALRLNIHLEAPTHKHIQTATETSKFGIDLERLPEVLSWLKRHSELNLVALAVHIGSQILDVEVFGAMSAQMGRVFNEVRAQGFPLVRLDLGGGLGIDYHGNGADDFERLDRYLSALAKHGTDAEIALEPGRFLVARAGALLTKVVYVKVTARQNFLILSAGMNALMRPALYQAYHRIEPVTPRSDRTTYTVVGPVCESTDVFAEGRELPTVAAGDWVAIFDAGAYGFVMANTYNETPVPQELTWGDRRLEIT